jgi:hypothetical protein
MVVDDLFEIAAEVSIKCYGRALRFGQRDRFREQTARMLLRRRYPRVTAAILHAFGRIENAINPARSLIPKRRLRDVLSAACCMKSTLSPAPYKPKCPLA